LPFISECAVNNKCDSNNENIYSEKIERSNTSPSTNTLDNLCIIHKYLINTYKIGSENPDCRSHQIWDENEERVLLNKQSNYSLDTTASEGQLFAGFCEIPNDHLAVIYVGHFKSSAHWACVASRMMQSF
jgi:hypothetical protein